MFSKLISDFKPHNMGLKKVLGDLEADIMEVVWKNSRCTVREVFEQIKARRSIAYTTVMTVMGRLADKGLLTKEQQGNAYVYCPTCSRHEFSTGIVKAVVDGLLEDFAEPAMAHFVDKMAGEDEQSIDRLENLIREKRNLGGK